MTAIVYINHGLRVLQDKDRVSPLGKMTDFFNAKNEKKRKNLPLE